MEEMTVPKVAAMLAAALLDGLDEGIFNEMGFDNFVDGLAFLLSILGPQDAPPPPPIYLSMN